MRIILPLAWTGVLALSMAALRVIPSLGTLTRLPRNLTDDDFIGLADALLILTARSHEWRFPGRDYTRLSTAASWVGRSSCSASEAW